MSIQTDQGSIGSATRRFPRCRRYATRKSSHQNGKPRTQKRGGWRSIGRRHDSPRGGTRSRISLARCLLFL